MNKFISAFKSEKTDKVIGYSFENASKSLFEIKNFKIQTKLAVFLKILRTKKGLTQEEVAKKIGEISPRHYQRIESGEENTTLSVIESIMKAFPDEDFSKIFKLAS